MAAGIEEKMKRDAIFHPTNQTKVNKRHFFVQPIKYNLQYKNVYLEVIKML